MATEVHTCILLTHKINLASDDTSGVLYLGNYVEFLFGSVTWTNLRDTKILISTYVFHRSYSQPFTIRDTHSPILIPV